jgi:nitrogenase molybdenum-iron protein alpha chain
MSVKTETKKNIIPNAEAIKEKMLEAYPPKVAKKRKKSIVLNKVGAEGEVPEVQANVRTIPGIITQRGCCYAGCKGVVVGPTRDILQIVHGPVGCSYYAWLTRRNQSKAEEGQAQFMPYALTTDMQDSDIVFGGEKKLKAAIKEAVDIFKPKAISIFATCPVGLIGDDIHSVAREMQKETGVTIFALSCEGYKGVSQSAGHHVANNAVFQHVVGKDMTPVEGKFKMNLLGEYNIGGDGFALEKIMEDIGVTLISTFSGNSTFDAMALSPQADVNMVQCHRSINYMATMMETKYGIPWFKVNFIGGKSTAKSLQRIAKYYDDPELTATVDAYVEKNMKDIDAAIAKYKPRLQGKTVLMYVGGSRAHHYQDLFKELGMVVLSAGYEFAHRDDYEGRKVLPSIKIDADSRNIEDLEIEADPELYNLRKTEEELANMINEELRGYEGMMPEMDENALVIDDISHHETEVLIKLLKPDLFCAGIKEKYVVQKSGVPLKQLHNYDIGGPYAGFEGAINFYEEIDRLVNGSFWKKIKAPWQESPELAGSYGAE